MDTKVLLTAAHCVEDAAEVRVGVGCTDRRSSRGCQYVDAKKFKVNKKYK